MNRPNTTRSPETWSWQLRSDVLKFFRGAFPSGLGAIRGQTIRCRFLRSRRVALILALVITSCCGAALAATPPGSQFAEKSPEAAFGVLAGQITGDRASGGTESEALEEQALEILDRAALEQLNGAPALGSSATQAAPDLNQVNMRLASFVTHQPPVGEAYRVARLGGSPPAYALVADFGLSGPSAVRVYAGAPGSLALAARIDRYAQKDFFDDYTELVTLPGPAAVFVTVTGRTDDLQTGFFTAWYFDGSALSPCGPRIYSSARVTKLLRTDFA